MGFLQLQKYTLSSKIHNLSCQITDTFGATDQKSRGPQFAISPNSTKLIDLTQFLCRGTHHHQSLVLYQAASYPTFYSNFSLGLLGWSLENSTGSIEGINSGSLRIEHRYISSKEQDVTQSCSQLDLLHCPQRSTSFQLHDLQHGLHHRPCASSSTSQLKPSVFSIAIPAQYLALLVI